MGAFVFEERGLGFVWGVWRAVWGGVGVVGVRRWAGLLGMRDEGGGGLWGRGGRGGEGVGVLGGD